MTTPRIIVADGDYDKILTLVKAVSQRNSKPLVIPHSSVPAGNLYVRQPETDLSVPYCLAQVAKDIRVNGEISPLVGTWFRDISSDTAPNIRGHSWTNDPAEVRARSKAKSERIVTARFTVDTAELDGQRLAVYLGLALDLYKEMEARLERAGADFAKKYPDKTPKIAMLSTLPQLYLKLDGYMLEGFAGLVSGGVIEPVE